MSMLNVIQLFGGIGIFLFSIKLISESLQLLAGNSMQNLIAMLTKTPILGVLVGTIVTVLIQSSSATTVMTVSFVDAGLMTLRQAIGVIMGANIGTTITGQIVAFKIKDYAYLFIIVGVLFNFFARSERSKYLGSGLLGFGLLFVGMQTMESSMSVLRDREDIFLAFSRNPFLGLLAGTILTLLVQSSSATVGLTIALGMQGLIPLEAAIPIILGDNVGTTITAVLASIGTSRTAKQACLAHVLFNVIGVCIFLPLLPFYVGFIASTSDSIGHQIANAHTMFNVCNALLFLPIVGIFATFIQRIIPTTQEKEKDITFLDQKLIEFTPGIAVDAVKNECLYMGARLLDAIDGVEELFFYNKASRFEELSRIENELDTILESVHKYSQQVMRAGVTDQELLRLHSYVRCAGDMERIGDKCKIIISIWDRQKKTGHGFSENAISELHELFDKANSAVEISIQNISLPHERVLEMIPEIETLSLDVRNLEQKFRQLHVERISTGTCAVDVSLNFLDLLGAIEHMSYRAKKMAVSLSMA